MSWFIKYVSLEIPRKPGDELVGVTWPVYVK